MNLAHQAVLVHSIVFTGPDGGGGEGRGGFGNIGPNWNFPFAGLIKYGLGVGLAIGALAGAWFFLTGLIGGVAKVKSGKGGASGSFISAALGLGLIVICGSGTAFMFGLSDSFAPYLNP